MAKVRKINEILTNEDQEYLGVIYEKTERNKRVLRAHTKYSEKQILRIAEVMLEYTIANTAVKRLNEELSEIQSLRQEAKQKYENSRIKKESNKYLKEYLGLTSKIKSLEEERDYYSYDVQRLENIAVEYDGIVNNALDREEERQANKNKVSDPSRPNGPRNK